MKRRTWAHNAHQWEIITEEESEAVSEIEDEPDLVNWDMCFHGCVYCEFASTLPRMEWHMRRRLVLCVVVYGITLNVCL